MSGTCTTTILDFPSKSMVTIHCGGSFASGYISLDLSSGLRFRIFLQMSSFLLFCQKGQIPTRVPGIPNSTLAVA